VKNVTRQWKPLDLGFGPAGSGPSKSSHRSQRHSNTSIEKRNLAIQVLCITITFKYFPRAAGLSFRLCRLANFHLGAWHQNSMSTTHPGKRQIEHSSSRFNIDGSIPSSYLRNSEHKARLRVPMQSFIQRQRLGRLVHEQVHEEKKTFDYNQSKSQSKSTLSPPIEDDRGPDCETLEKTDDE